MTALIVLGAAILATVLMKAPWFVQARPIELERIARLGFIGLAALAVIVLAASGRFSAALIALIALLPFSSVAQILWQNAPQDLQEAEIIASQGVVDVVVDQMDHQDEIVVDSQILSRSQALDILGLQEGATLDEITQAHESLAQKLHPNNGGSEYLSTQVDRARETLRIA